jgi:hypothetical protein
VVAWLRRSQRANERGSEEFLFACGFHGCESN